MMDIKLQQTQILKPQLTQELKQAILYSDTIPRNWPGILMSSLWKTL